MTLLVAINGWDPAPWIARFKERADGRRVVGAQDAFAPPDIHYAAVWKPQPGLLAQYPNLRAVFNLGAGVDALLADTTLPDVPICRVVNADLTARMSEYIVLNVLMHLRQICAYRALQMQHRWEPIEQPSARDVRVGMMGMGVLGTDAADILARLGFQVAGWSRSGHPPPSGQSYRGGEELGAFLARTDILVVLLPLTSETKGVLNAELFGALARDGALGGPILINAGRGGLQVEADILACLENGTLKAASLDVFETEPLPVHSRLWSHPAVVITPHVAADSMPDTIVDAIIANIAGFESGETLKDQVSRQSGY